MSEDRFEFGKNWESYSQLIDEDRIAMATSRLVSLLGVRSLSGRSFLDIGCGSGLHALAALRLGAEGLLAIDFDPDSVATTRKVLERFWGKPNQSVRRLSVFDLDKEGIGNFDIVYSWGVLHHTGDMNRAIRIAAAHVKPGGLFAVALYGKTRFCGAWTKIKRWYVNASPGQRARAERIYVRLYGLYLLLRGKLLSTHIASYEKKRGMDFYHDVRDWIGGYPYESISPGELSGLLTPIGFELVRQNVRKRSGLFGSGNDEYVYRRRDGAR
jgi:2-polyprenyl-6-hydroxyphenyl methylase/3-demethylubiquinone-9 3-methyltransferase